jgi:hypothetical protein
MPSQRQGYGGVCKVVWNNETFDQHRLPLFIPPSLVPFPSVIPPPIRRLKRKKRSRELQKDTPFILRRKKKYSNDERREL